MAFSNMFGGQKKHLLKVKSYSINQKNVLGQGAFGIVYQGIDGKKNVIAAKRIDGNKHPRVLSQGFYRFLDLDHPNVMKILDAEKTENIVWMMMPFCEFGDLNGFYRKRDALHEANLDVMKQIMSGIRYLHSQDIVHRDIKPRNILVASEIPLILQLADYDVSKCLDPEVETSLMTSNVGTLAFKAPEFFRRTSPGRIEYHRNVDVYAAGLTFLAILQAQQGKRLIPHIETPMDDSELHVPSIGQLIAERIKYNVPELNIVTLSGCEQKLKLIINQMTCFNPEERLPAVRILDLLVGLEIKKIKLILKKSFPVSGSMDVTEKDELLVRVIERRKCWIRVLDRQTGDLINEIPSMCNHNAYLNKHPRHADHVLESCPTCKHIRAYNIKRAESFPVCQGSFPRISSGPGESLLILDRERQLFKLKWDTEQREAQLHYIRQVRDVPKKNLKRFCYVECHNILLLTFEKENDDQDNEIIAVKLESENIIWRLFGSVEVRTIKPECITCDPEGNAYVSDRGNNRILKIDSLTGDVLSILLIGQEGKEIYSMRWSKKEPNLTCKLEGVPSISTYFIRDQ